MTPRLFLLLLLPTLALGESKKGVGFWNADDSFRASSRQVDELQCGWYYNWTPTPDRQDASIRAEFVPMIWGARDLTTEKLEQVNASGSRHLLTFNEPDVRDQANMTVEQALAAWPRLMETGLRLGSPAPAAAPNAPGWFDRFMREADARGLRVDFLCLHWYGDITTPDAVEQLRSFLNGYWERYRRPIWLTEFAGSTGAWLKLSRPPMSAEKNAAFIARAIPMLESLPFVERYSWFELNWIRPPWADAGLVNPRTGKLTVAGLAWRSQGPDVPPPPPASPALSPQP